jgi:transcription elongation factor SPT6
MSASEDDPMALHEGDEDETDESDLDHEMIQEDDGFIVNDDDAEQDYDTSVYFKVNREKKRKARRIQNDEDEDENELDEEDRLLVEENTGIQFARKLKKLKRGRDRMAVDQSTRADHDLDKIFEQDYIENQEEEFNDFIEDDEDNDDEDNRDRHDARKQERQGRTHPPPPMAAARLTGGVDQVHDIADIFHDRDGQEFGWALDEEEEEETRPLGGIDSLKEVFEPGELQAKMMTDQDEEIRILDVPERMQLAWIAHDIKADPTIAAKDPYPTYVEEDVMRETAFIVKKLLHDPALAFIADQLEELVRITLKFFYKERLEVPFIHAHRRDYFSRFEMEQETCLLSRDHLWAIWDYSMQFRALKRRKQVLLERCARLATPDMYAHDMVQSATTFEELEDVGYYLRIHYASELRSNTSVKKTDAYITERLKKIATGGILQAFGLSAQEFGENMLAGVKARFVKDVQSTPSIEASQYANLYHDSAEKVLLGMLALM